MDDSEISQPSASGPQLAVFSYFHFNPAIHEHEKPYEILINLPIAQAHNRDYRRHNEEFESCTTVVDDVRGRESDFTLDRNGFCWRDWEGPIDWKGLRAQDIKELGHDWIQSGYIKYVENFIKAELEKMDGQPIDIVKVFDYRLRVSSHLKDFEGRTLDLNDGLDPIIPVIHPHVDQSFEGAATRVRVHMGDRARELLKRRFRIINVWRPLAPVVNWPLAACDSRTVSIEDLVPADLVRKQYVGETFYSTYNANHRWYYRSDQKPTEVTMLKIHDSDPSADTRFCLHSSFQLAGHGVKDTRESFEVRALVFDALA
ncbi:hypothetical protein F4860DRAFT_530119 [Xylaria cubensis]|nr:hypothetical protein F4860DRAFT_530119 [Xylaria cubensis]